MIDTDCALAAYNLFDFKKIVKDLQLNQRCPHHKRQWGGLYKKGNSLSQTFFRRKIFTTSCHCYLLLFFPTFWQLVEDLECALFIQRMHVRMYA